jgi:hypothetical protein
LTGRVPATYGVCSWPANGSTSTFDPQAAGACTLVPLRFR